MSKSVLVLFCVVLAAASSTQGARILGVFTTPSLSHQVVFQPIWKELSLRGHQVVVMTPNPLKDPTLTNLTEIDLGFTYENWNNMGIATLGVKEHTAAEEFNALSNTYTNVLEGQLSHPEVRRYIEDENENFDLLLVEYLHPVMYAFKDIFDCPMVGITSIGMTSVGYEAIGNPNHPALNPDFQLPFSTNLSFKERILSTLFNVVYRFMARYKVAPQFNAMTAKYFGKVRPVEKLMQEVSLVLVNSNLALQNVKPTVPAFVEISGIHIREKQPLPTDLQKYLDDAEEGVVYFSLGSNIKSKLLPQEKLNLFMEAFAKLPYKVLWKFENEHLPNKSSNVEIRHWLPQQDVLGHHNIKAFVTQGGLQSLDEAVHNGVPVVSMPFFGDQRYNTHHLVEMGGALSINFQKMTADELAEKIMEVASNPTFRKTINKLSRIANDHPEPALEKAVWWIEYVIRHDGAPHLRYPGADIPFYQYWLLDVIAFLVVVASLVLYVVAKVFKKAIALYGVVRKAVGAVTTPGTEEKTIHVD